MKRPCLQFQDSQGSPKLYEISREEVVIGRKSDSDIALLDPYISRHHAKIVKQGDGFSIEDLQSTHGTFLNGQRIEKESLKPGDHIRLGRLELFFTDQPEKAWNLITSTAENFDLSLTRLKSAFSSQEQSEFTDLEKINCILDLQYLWGQEFSSAKTFRQILKSALDISGAERGFIMVRRNEAFDYELGLSGKGSVLPESDFRTSKTIVRRVTDSEEPVFMTEGIEGELAQQQSIQEMRLRALACLPLKGISANSERPELLGILYLDSRKRMHALSGLDQKILNRLATEAGSVLEKVEMIKTIEERKDFEQELTLAYETQKALLPQIIPQFGHLRVRALSEPTRYVGGDFYDFLELRPNELTGVLADVSGKGISAALVSSLLQGALDMECRSGAPLEKVLAQVNKFLVERTAANRFVTLFLFSLDSRGKGRFVSAGHNPAYIYRSSPGQVEKLSTDGMILGAFDFATYQSHQLELDRGDVLFVYSDGVTEATDPRGEMFGEDRLQDVIQSSASHGAEALEKSLLNSLDQFTRGMPQTDDITFLLIERIGSG